MNQKIHEMKIIRLDILILIIISIGVFIGISNWFFNNVYLAVLSFIIVLTPLSYLFIQLIKVLLEERRKVRE